MNQLRWSAKPENYEGNFKTKFSSFKNFLKDGGSVRKMTDHEKKRKNEELLKRQK